MEMNQASPKNRRPSSIEDMEAVFERLDGKESRERGLAFKPKPTDVIISPYGKSGTTWLQQIAHGLRTRGSMDFDEITEVTPWIEVAYNLGWDLEAAQVAKPRVYKSHLAWNEIPKGARYICSIRDPEAVAVSFYRFMEGWFFEAGSIPIDAFVRWQWPKDEMQERGYWQHLVSWWEQRSNPDVLLLSYENMKADLRGTVKKVAGHMGIELDDELENIVLQQSSKEFMLAHKYHFDDKYMRRRTETIGRLPPNSISLKVMLAHNESSRYHLAAETKQYLDDIWKEQIESRFGFRNYSQLRLAL